MKRSKRYREAVKVLDSDKIYSIEEAVGVLKNMPHAKFDETLELSVKLGVDPRQSDQMIRGSVVLPHGTGKEIKIIVFCEPDKEQEAKQAGADFVGGQDLVDKIQKENWLDFDYCIATPSMMRVVSKLGKVLGPRGMMPSPKTGTVTDKIEAAVKEAKRGKIDFRLDKFGCINIGLGKISFSEQALVENIRSFVEALFASKTQAVKGDFIKSTYLSTTISPSLQIKL